MHACACIHTYPIDTLAFNFNSVIFFFWEDMNRNLFIQDMPAMTGQKDGFTQVYLSNSM